MPRPAILVSLAVLKIIALLRGLKALGRLEVTFRILVHAIVLRSNGRSVEFSQKVPVDAALLIGPGIVTLRRMTRVVVKGAPSGRLQECRDSATPATRLCHRDGLNETLKLRQNPHVLGLKLPAE